MIPARSKPLVDPVLAFSSRCEARALLYHAGDITLHEAVDGLKQAAEESGLIQTIGQDQMQTIMSNAFTAVRKLEADRW